MFNFSCVGSQINDNGTNVNSHANTFLYDRIIGTWIRFEPGGLSHNDLEQYGELDNYIKIFKPLYISHNDYYYFPGLHVINPGPYCAYYSLMFIEKYIELRCTEPNFSTQKNVLFDTIEQISDREYIGRKLVEYEGTLGK